jgi:hypothetical protein
MPKPRLCLTFAAFISYFAGCGGRPGGAPTLPANGVVLYKSQPVAGVQVVFTPQAGRPAMADTDAEGNFTLMTFRPDDGAVPGKHKVAIVDRQRQWVADPKAAPPPSRFPARYQSVATTPWEVEVKEGSDNEFKLEMTD